MAVLYGVTFLVKETLPKGPGFVNDSEGPHVGHPQKTSQNDDQGHVKQKGGELRLAAFGNDNGPETRGPTSLYRSKSRNTSSYQSLLSFNMIIIWFFSMAIPMCSARCSIHRI